MPALRAVRQDRTAIAAQLGSSTETTLAAPHRVDRTRSSSTRVTMAALLVRSCPGGSREETFRRERDRRHTSPSAQDPRGNPSQRESHQAAATMNAPAGLDENCEPSSPPFPPRG